MVKNTAQNPSIQKGVDAVHTINADEAFREQVRLREKALNDYYNEMSIVRSEGRMEGAISVLSSLVKDGTLTSCEAANKLNMSVSEFESRAGLTS